MNKVAILAGIIILGAAIAAFVTLRPVISEGQVASAYVAKQVCSCLFVGERPLESCKGDFTEDISALTIAVEGETVTTSALFNMIGSSASHEEGLGCTLDKSR